MFIMIQIQFIIMKHNEHEIPKIQKLAKEWGIDYLQLKKVGIMDPSMNKKEIKKYLPSNKYAKYTDEGKIKFKNNMCDSIYEEAVINWDGTVVPCCYDMNGAYVFGNIFEEPFSKIWNNQKYITFRRNVLKNKSKIPMCSNCAGTTKGVVV